MPPSSVKTVVDAWHGYDSLLLNPEQGHLTTFMTEEGPLWHNLGPQGCYITQDAYTQRYDAITKDVLRKQQVIDDSLLYDPVANIKEYWWRVIDYLILSGKNGIIFNTKKIQFSQLDVEFAGHKITEDSVRPFQNTWTR